MKRILAILLILLLTGVSALAGNVKFTGSCPVYKKRGGEATSTIIARGSVAKKTDACGKWVQIQLTDKKKTRVWVPAKYVKDTKAEVSIIYSAGGWRYSSEGSGAEEPVFASSGTMRWKCNLRARPSLSGKSLITVPKGAKVRLLGTKKADSRGIYWYKASYKGKTGWISNGRDY